MDGDDDEPSAELDMWEVFTEYNLRTNPLEPDRMTLGAFRKLCKDSGGVQNLADAEVAFTAEVAKTKRATLSFSGFLEATMRVAIKTFPRVNQAEAFHRLLTEYVLLNANRRVTLPFEVHDTLALPGVVDLKCEYEQSLKELMGGYDSSNQPRKSVGSSGFTLSFGDFVRFMQDFGLMNVRGFLSTYQVGDVFLWALGRPPEESDLGRINFDQFWDCLVRCSLVVFLRKIGVSDVNKVKGLFMYMWRAMQRSGYDESKKGQTPKTAAMMSALKFKNKFTQMWQGDNYRNYLTAQSPDELNPRLLLKSIPSPSKRESEWGIQDGDEVEIYE